MLTTRRIPNKVLCADNSKAFAVATAAMCSTPASSPRAFRTLGTNRINSGSNSSNSSENNNTNDSPLARVVEESLSRGSRIAPCKDSQRLQQCSYRLRVGLGLLAMRGGVCSIGIRDHNSNNTDHNNNAAAVSSIIALQRRHLIDTKSYNMGPAEQGDNVREHMSIIKLQRGVAYQKQRKIWPSVERLERHMTAQMFPSAMGRDELGMLPLPGRGDRDYAKIGRGHGNDGGDDDKELAGGGHALILEGKGAHQLLKSVHLELEREKENKKIAGTRLQFADDDEDLMMQMYNGASAVGDGAPLSHADFNDSVEKLGEGLGGKSRASHPQASSLSTSPPSTPSTSTDKITDKMFLTNRDLEGTTLASFGPARDALLEELLGDRRSMNDNKTGQALWDSIPNLHPFIAERAATVIAPTATRTQSRLLTSLLHEDHHDVLMSSPSGAGKTWSLVLAALNGVHSEDAGVNILVAPTATAAQRMLAMVHAICGEYGGTVAGRDVKDMKSWIGVGLHLEENQKLYRSIMGAANRGEGHGKRLLITTTNTLTDLFFSHMLQFASSGYLRRVYLDDIGQQLRMLPDNASIEMAKERLAEPRTVEQLLATLHQLPGPHIRALFQLGLVGNDLDTEVKTHLDKLCLKQESKTIIMTPHRIPSSLHVTYSFFNTYGQRFDPSVDFDPALMYAKDFIFNARHTIPGRAVIFVPNTADLYLCRSQLRRMGMDVKVLSEITGFETLPNGEIEWKEGWKFLLLKEQDSVGLRLPLVSHCFVTFPPATRHGLASMASVASQVGSVGWVTVLANQSMAPHVREVAEELALPFVDHVINKDLSTMPKEKADRLSRPPAPLGMDPQQVVKSHYLMQTDLAAGNGVFDREFFGNDRRKAWSEMFVMDYEQLSDKQSRLTNARKLDMDLAFNPSAALDLQKMGLVDEKLHPTKKMKHTLTHVPTASRTGRSGLNLYSNTLKSTRAQK